jgi:broad specificity phosphatase PhoE
VSGTKYLELRRHTANDGDVLSPDGIATAVSIGRRLSADYAAVWSSGAQRATQTAACILAGLGRTVAGGVLVQQDLRSLREDEWLAAYSDAGAGDLASLRAVDPDLVEEDAEILGRALMAMIEELGDGERGLAIGHSPTNEAAVYGLTGIIVPPLAKGGGVLVTALDDGYAVEELG